MPAAALSSVMARPAAATRVAARVGRVSVKPMAGGYRWQSMPMGGMGCGTRGFRIPMGPAVMQGWNCDPNTAEAWRKGMAGLESLMREYEEGATGLFDSSPFTRRAAAATQGRKRPIPFDVIEEEGRVFLMFDLPGVPRADVQIKIAEDNTLTVAVNRPAPKSTGAAAEQAASEQTTSAQSAQQAAPPMDSDSIAVQREGARREEPAAQQPAASAEPRRTVVRLERPYGNFSRSVKLPKDVDADRISAKLADGVLTLTVPKLASQPEAPSVNIRVD